MKRRLKTTEDFLMLAREKHGNRYDYSDSVYVNAKTKITIICTIHGMFYQNPYSHAISGIGCRFCTYEEQSVKKRCSITEFIEKATNTHGNRYGYSDINYINSMTPIDITCKEHGKFTQLPSTHLRGCGCPDCSIFGKRYDTEKFITEAIKIHGNKYNYDNFEYTSSHIKSIVICPQHGAFHVTPTGHLSGKGCRKCRYELQSINSRMSVSEFTTRANAIHNSVYDYSMVNYINSNTPVCIICPDHGEFHQSPSNHLQGQRCGGCNHYGFNTSRPAWVYIVIFNSYNQDSAMVGSFIKIGITNNIELRMKSLDNQFMDGVNYTIKDTKSWYFENGADAAIVESMVLEGFKDRKYTDLMETSFDGKTELLYTSAYDDVVDLLTEVIMDI